MARKSVFDTEAAVSQVRIDPRMFEKELAKFINDNAEAIAKQVAADAKATTAFQDKTGELRRSIRAKKSRFEDGGWIVQATAPHAHLLEFGTKNMGAKSFLRPALSRNVEKAKAAFGAK